MTGEEFKAWRERMGFNRSQAAEALGIGRNQPQKYEDEGATVPAYIRLACEALEAGDTKEELGQDYLVKAAHERDLTPEDLKDSADFALTQHRPDVRLKEIVAVTMWDGENRPFPSIHRYYVEWFDSNGLQKLTPEIEDRLFQGLKGAVITEGRQMERSALGQVQAFTFFEKLELLGIFTPDRAKALLDCWSSPINLHTRFYG